MLRRAVDHAASALGILARREHAMRGTLTILMYHRVLPPDLWTNAPLVNLVMPEPAFRAQMELLASSFAPVRLDEGLRALRENAVRGRALVAVTFDDGYADNHAFAAPVLRKLSIPATFFLVAGHLGTDAELWFDRAARLFAGARPDQLAHAAKSVAAPLPANASRAEFMAVLKTLAPEARDAMLDAIPLSPATPPRGELDRLMSFEQARDLARAGHEIGSHTLTHPILTTLTPDHLRREITESKLLLERELGQPVAGFCPPNGSYDDTTLNAIRLAGYQYAPTTRFGRVADASSPFTLPRIDMNPHHATHRGTHDRALALAHITLLHHDLRRR